MTFLDEHPIAERVVEQRIRERIHEWVIQNRPDVAVEMRRVMMEQLEQQSPTIYDTQYNPSQMTRRFQIPSDSV